MTRIEPEITDPKYWDCMCETHYIHLKADRQTCPLCGACEWYMPDSHIGEISDPNNLFEVSA